MTINVDPTPLATWGLWHPEHGFTQFLLIDRALFLVLSNAGAAAYTFHEGRDAADARHLAIKITTEHEARGWAVGDFVWGHAIQLNFEDFLHDARGNPPWMQEELTAMINKTINLGEALQ